MTITIAIPPQKGKVTHHQDHVMCPVNFKITKATPSNPIAETPEDDEEDDETFVAIFISIYLILT